MAIGTKTGTEPGLEPGPTAEGFRYRPGLRVLAQRAVTAFRAASERCAGVRFAAVAGPPLSPPFRPSATACGFFFLVGLAMPGMMPERLRKVKPKEGVDNTRALVYRNAILPTGDPAMTPDERAELDALVRRLTVLEDMMRELAQPVVSPSYIRDLAARYLAGDKGAFRAHNRRVELARRLKDHPPQEERP